MAETIEVSLPGPEVRRLGGNKAFEALLALAETKAAAEGKQLVSREHKDSSTLVNTASDRYVTAFKVR